MNTKGTEPKKAAYYAYRYYCEGLSYSEIAKLEGVSRQAVYTTINNYTKNHAEEVVKIRAQARLLLAARCYLDSLSEENKDYIKKVFNLTDDEIPEMKKTFNDYITFCRTTGIMPA